jgi:hypothetical protein
MTGIMILIDMRLPVMESLKNSNLDIFYGKEDKAP